MPSTNRATRSFECGHHPEIDVGLQLHPFRMDRQDRLAALQVGTVDDDLSVEPPRALEGGIEKIGTVGGGHDDDAHHGVESVEFHQELVQSLFTLLVAHRRAGAGPNFPETIDLIDEDDAGRSLPYLPEEVSNPRGDLPEFRDRLIHTRHIVEGHPGGGVR